MSASAPRARRHRIRAEVVADDLLIYDLSSHETHCLNRTAACVWELADGTRSVDELAAELAARCGVPRNADLVRLSLAQLAERNLLADAEPAPVHVVSRRTLVARLGS